MSQGHLRGVLCVPSLSFAKTASNPLGATWVRAGRAPD
jgi:hypothetical protein